ncbi:MAG: transcription termination factor Rho, partial [Candidatus Latescibacteria bacterium]|nr:transcription termination factor Rho [Candidatus Latescibacterota bacterium]
MAAAIENIDMTQLQSMNIKQLQALMEQLGIPERGAQRRQDLIYRVLKHQIERNGNIVAHGTLEVRDEGLGFLRSAAYSYMPGPDDIYVSNTQIKRFGLRTGDTISGQIRPPKNGEKHFALLRIEEINAASPEVARRRALFENLTALHPTDRLKLEWSADDMTTRILDLLSPVGKGQRGLIVAPPFTG